MTEMTNMETFEMDIPPEARAKYLQRREKDLSDCQAALLSHDFEVFMRIGHQLKGNATTFGFDPLSEIGIRMEEAAKQKNLPEIQKAIMDFQSYLKSQNSSH